MNFPELQNLETKVYALFASFKALRSSESHAVDEMPLLDLIGNYGKEISVLAKAMQAEKESGCELSPDEQKILEKWRLEE